MKIDVKKCKNDKTKYFCEQERNDMYRSLSCQGTECSNKRVLLFFHTYNHDWRNEKSSVTSRKVKLPLIDPVMDKAT